jgi:hypothetical protein
MSSDALVSYILHFLHSSFSKFKIYTKLKVQFFSCERLLPELHVINPPALPRLPLASMPQFTDSLRFDYARFTLLKYNAALASSRPQLQPTVEQ